MEVGKYEKGKWKQSGRAEKCDKIVTEETTPEEHRDTHDGCWQNTELAAVDMEGSIATGYFQDRIRDNLKKELANIRWEIQQKRSGNQFSKLQLTGWNWGLDSRLWRGNWGKILLAETPC